MFRLAWGTFRRALARNELTCIACAVLAAISCGDDYINPANTLQGVAGARAQVFNNGSVPEPGAAADSRQDQVASVTAGGSSPSPASGSSSRDDSARKPREPAPNESPEPDPDAAYGWVRFDEAQLGSGETPNDELRKPLEVRLDPPADWSKGPAYVTRSSTTTPYVDVIIPLKNTGSELRCFVKADPMVWKRADDEIISGDRISAVYVSGSAGTNGTVTVTSCLAPGETGYFLEVDSSAAGAATLFEQLAIVELALQTRTESEFRRPAYRVVASSFSHADDALAVTFENLGSAAAPIELGQAEYVLLDAKGEPLTWGFLDIPDLSSLAPEARAIGKNDVFYDGKSSSLLVRFSY